MKNNLFTFLGSLLVFQSPDSNIFDIVIEVV